MNYITLVAATVLVAACSSNPITVHKPVEVQVPVPVPCIKQDDVPVCPPSIVDSVDMRGKMTYEQLQAVLQDHEQLRSCSRELSAALVRCTETTK